jgi:CRP/FNR family transcriptional regulator
VFDALTDDELEDLVKRLRERRLRARQLLFAAGDSASRVYVVLKGRVKTYQIANNGKEIILEIVERGGVVGDLPSSLDGERRCHAQAIEDSLLLHFSWEDFAGFMKTSPAFGGSMAELTADRLRRAQQAFVDLVTKPVSARLADLLLRMTQDGEVRHGLTHQELAQSIGTSRETVTALLNRLVLSGVLACVPGGYAVVDAAELEAVAAGRTQVSSRYPVATELAVAAS